MRRKYAWHRITLACRGIDLGRVSIENLGLDKSRSFYYSNSGGPALAAVLRSLPISSSDSALDIGCGKGGAIITMACLPFERVDGIEVSADLVRVARRNLKRMGIGKSTIILADAAEFRALDPYTFLYMFHPFPEVVLRAVLENIRQSLVRRPRRITILYKNAVYHGLMVECGFKDILTGDANFPCKVYVADGGFKRPTEAQFY
jgi:SAM-dependent methyltransferase